MNVRRIILAILPLLLPLYVVRFHIGPLPTTLLEVGAMTMVLAWFFTRGKAHHHAPLRGWITPIGLWLLAGLIAVAVAPDHVAALGLWRAYFLEPVLVFVMLLDLVRTEEDRRTLLRSLIIVTGVLAAWAILQWVGVLSIPKPWNVPPNGIRATGPFPFPNALALFAAPVAALCFSSVVGAIHELPPQRVWLWVGFGSALLATILAKSAGGIIAICVAVFITLVIRRKTRLIAIGGTLFAILVIAAIPSIRKPVTEKIFFDAWSGKVRLVMWKETQNMLRDHPIFGVGLGAYPDAIKPYHNATWMEIFQYPHNILLNLWSEIGLLGIVAFGWILWIWIKSNKKQVARSKGSENPDGKTLATCYLLPATSLTSPALPVILAILVHGIVDVPYFKNDLAMLFWILVILTMSDASLLHGRLDATERDDKRGAA